MMEAITQAVILSIGVTIAGYIVGSYLEKIKEKRLAKELRAEPEINPGTTFKALYINGRQVAQSGTVVDIRPDGGIIVRTERGYMLFQASTFMENVQLIYGPKESQ